MTELRLEALSYGTRLREVDLTARPGETVGLVGPNGSGKTTLLRCVQGILTPTSGRALLDGDDLHTLTPKARARRIAGVPQDSSSEFELTVREVVALGRSPHKRFWETDTAEDRARVERALTRVGVAELADRPYPTLSGGERQRALVARALVQDPALLVLDEPTNHLDIRHQLDVLGLARRLGARGTTNILALHDLNLAAAHCDRLYVLERGRVVAEGPPGEVLTPALLAAVYGVAAEVIPHPTTGTPTVLYLPGPPVEHDLSAM
ncbi:MULTISPECIES: ABC transporter ATP-binding protein [Streptomyces]|uniref:ABC transporter ATP-binding protein n=1 Tax=Streptomyces TaxID=1883 RepID=UPI001316AA1D|nr:MULTISPECIES: ABC transporter ATP-binding protein [Streptomyces]QGZ49142.1 ATP-binding cassette domain-containing protein [Streptomyces sp. QHH-9511]GGT91104.1 ABC transporter ATP-binding protein [Streptomyces lateritius]